MSTRTLTSEGNIHLGKDDIAHLGIEPGELVDVQQLPGGELTFRARPARGSIDAFIGSLSGKTTKNATLEEIQEACEAGWAGLVDLG